MQVTAIVSAYYAEQYLRDRIENLLSQSLRPEIVVICQSGSPEDAIVGEYLDKETPGFVGVFTPDVPTIYKAWNLGIRVSSGKYLTNANSDDLLLPKGLAKLAGALDSHKNVDLVYGNQLIRNEAGEQIGRFVWNEGGFTQLLQGCFVGPMPMWRKSVHDEVGFFNEDLHVAGDYDFWLKLSLSGSKFLHLREDVGIYLKRESSAEHRQPFRTTWETARVRALYLQEVDKQCSSNSSKKV